MRTGVIAFELRPSTQTCIDGVLAIERMPVPVGVASPASLAAATRLVQLFARTFATRLARLAAARFSARSWRVLFFFATGVAATFATGSAAGVAAAAGGARPGTALGADAGFTAGVPVVASTGGGARNRLGGEPGPTCPASAGAAGPGGAAAVGAAAGSG